MENTNGDFTSESENVDLNNTKIYMINIDNVFVDVAV